MRLCECECVRERFLHKKIKFLFLLLLCRLVQFGFVFIPLCLCLFISLRLDFDMIKLFSNLIHCHPYTLFFLSFAFSFWKSNICLFYPEHYVSRAWIFILFFFFFFLYARTHLFIRHSERKTLFSALIKTLLSFHTHKEKRREEKKMKENAQKI